MVVSATSPCYKDDQTIERVSLLSKSQVRASRRCAYRHELASATLVRFRHSDTSERAHFRYEYLRGLEIEVSSYQRLSQVFEVLMPVRELDSLCSFPMVRASIYGGTSDSRTQRKR
jgi:hypothetical protein